MYLGMHPTYLRLRVGIDSQAVGTACGREAFASWIPTKGRKHMPASDVFCGHQHSADIAPTAHHDISGFRLLYNILLLYIYML